MLINGAIFNVTLWQQSIFGGKNIYQINGLHFYACDSLHLEWTIGTQPSIGW